jgi:hypothetical protein
MSARKARKASNEPPAKAIPAGPVARGAEMKALNSQRTQAAVAVEQAERQLAAAQAHLGTCQQRLTEIDRRIAALENDTSKVVVSEHALLRYFERVLGFDLREIESKLLSERTMDAIRQVRTCRIRVDGGLALVVKNGVVVSIVPAPEADKKPRYPPRPKSVTAEDPPEIAPSGAPAPSDQA